jgi:AcrR family transcriptional regulator
MKRAENARKTRDALVKAGLQAVARHGYAKASVTRITEASGVAAGTFYSYFQSHKHFLDDLLPTEGVHLLHLLGQSARRSRDYFDHEKITFLALSAYLKQRPYFLRVLAEAEIAAPKSFAQHMRNIEDRYLRALHRAQAGGEIRSQSDRSFRVIAEVLSGARGQIAVGFSDRSSARAFRPADLPDWVADSYVKFVRYGLSCPRLPTRSMRDRRVERPVRRDNDTRSLLLDAATQVVYRCGYAGASVQAITKAAGFSVGTFYAHFASRQELVEELLTHIRSDMLAEMRDAVRGSRSFAELECRGFHRYFEYLLVHPWYSRIETEAAVWAPATYLGHVFDLIDRYTNALRRSRAHGELQRYEERELPVLACIFLAARHYLASRYVLASSQPKRLPGWVGSTYFDLVCQGLAGPSPLPVRDAGG